jgi:hypothetical protein
MKPGDLVIVKGTSTGDPSWMVELYRERIPVLVLALNSSLQVDNLGSKWVQVHYKGGEPKYLSSSKCEVISEAG